MKVYNLIILVVLVCLGCQSGPSPIKYGTQACHFCSMTIVDKQHAAQIVTNKGKVYNFDATECMVNYFNKEINALEDAKFYVCDYKHEEILIDAKVSTFLISKKIPSPMGAFLSAFKSLKEAKDTQKTHPGEIYTWDELIEYFKKKKGNHSSHG